MKIIKGLVFLPVVLLPFLKGGYFLYSFFIISTLFVILLWRQLSVKQGKLLLPKGLQVIGVSLILIGYFISIFIGIDLGMSFIGFLKALALLIVFVVLNQCDDELHSKVLHMAIMSIIAMCIVSFLCLFINPDWVIQQNRFGGLVQYPNTFALLITVSILYVVTYKRSEYLFLLPFLVGLLILTYSRSMIVMACLGILLCGIAVRKEGYKRLLFTCLLLCLGIALGILLTGFFDFGDSAKRLQEIHAGDSSFLTRIIYYVDGLKMILRKPMGYGYWGYLFIQRAMQTGIYFVKYIHSSLLQLTLDGGIIAGLGFILYIVSSFCHGKVTVQGKIIAFIILLHSMLDFDFQFMIIWVLLFLCLQPYGMENRKVFKIHKGAAWLPLGLGLVYLATAVMGGLSYTSHYKEALRIYPLHTESKIKYMKQTEDTSLKVALAESIVKWNPSVLEANKVLRDHALWRKDYLDYSMYAKTVRDLHQLSAKELETYCRSLLFVVKSDIINKELKRQAYEEIRGIDSYVKEKVSAINPIAYKVKHPPELSMTPGMIEIIDEALSYEHIIKE